DVGIGAGGCEGKRPLGRGIKAGGPWVSPRLFPLPDVFQGVLIKHRWSGAPAVADKATIEFRIDYGKVNTRRVVDLSHELSGIDIDHDHVRAVRHIQSPGGTIYCGMIPSVIASNGNGLQEPIIANGRCCHGAGAQAQHKQYRYCLHWFFPSGLIPGMRDLISAMGIFNTSIRLHQSSWLAAYQRSVANATVSHGRNDRLDRCIASSCDEIAKVRPARISVTGW